jgi:hypothetical protein
MQNFYDEYNLSDLFGEPEATQQEEAEEIEEDEAIYLWRTRVWGRYNINYKKYIEEIEQYRMPKIEEDDIITPIVLLQKITVSHSYMSRLLKIFSILNKNFNAKKRSLAHIRLILYRKASGKTAADKEASVASLITRYIIELGEAEDALESVKSAIEDVKDLQMQISRIEKLLSMPNTRILLQDGMLIPENIDSDVRGNEVDQLESDESSNPWAQIRKTSQKNAYNG